MMTDTPRPAESGARPATKLTLNRETVTYREILEQPAAWRRALADARLQSASLASGLGQPLGSSNLVVTGCGSSYYLALATAAQLRIALGRPVAAVPASELLIHSAAALGEVAPYVLIAISRSGETTETVLAAEQARREHGAVVLSITCYPGSALARAGDVTLLVESGQESSVVMTKSFTSMLLATQAVASEVGGTIAASDLDALPGLLDRLLPEHVDRCEAAGIRAGVAKRVFLGSGPYYGLACEANLKMKEMAIVTSEVYHNLEFRHGPISIVDSSTLVTCFVSDAGRSYEVPLLAELKAMGAALFVVCERKDPAVEAQADYLVELKSGVPEAARATLFLPFVHLMAYACAVSRGENPDSPRNLTQVVKL